MIVRFGKWEIYGTTDTESLSTSTVRIAYRISFNRYSFPRLPSRIGILVVNERFGRIDSVG